MLMYFCYPVFVNDHYDEKFSCCLKLNVVLDALVSRIWNLESVFEVVHRVKLQQAVT